MSLLFWIIFWYIISVAISVVIFRQGNKMCLDDEPLIIPAFIPIANLVVCVFAIGFIIKESSQVKKRVQPLLDYIAGK